jgi:hypothetical protein
MSDLTLRAPTQRAILDAAHAGDSGGALSTIRAGEVCHCRGWASGSCWTAAILHDIPGRIRIKIPNLRANPQLASQLQARVQGIPGVRRAKANPLTGSLLVDYGASESVRTQILNSLGVMHISPAQPQRMPILSAQPERMQSPEIVDKIAHALCNKLIDFALHTALTAIL